MQWWSKSSAHLRPIYAHKVPLAKFAVAGVFVHVLFAELAEQDVSTFADLLHHYPTIIIGLLLPVFIVAAKFDDDIV